MCGYRVGVCGYRVGVCLAIEYACVLAKAIG